MTEDSQLLRRYVEERSEDAFTELVNRHVNLVYFAALRRVGGDAHLADDVAQSVFADLARKAASLQDRAVLTGWLYTSTRFAAAQAVRTARRRRTHEQEAHTMHELHATPESNWEQLRPVIDEAMDELNESEREAVLLRFFESRPLAEVGAKFSLSADAARMRIDRALDKLRGLLAKRGIASTSAALATIITSQSGLAAPAGSVARIVAGALSQAGAATTATLASWKILGGGAVAALGIGLVLHRTTLSREPDAASPATLSVSAPETARPAVEAAAPKIAAPPTALPAPAIAPASLPIAAEPSPLAAGDDFARLSEMQKDILKKLWDHQQTSSLPVAARWAFRPGPGSPDLMAFEVAVAKLRTRDWVGVGVQGGVFLTAEGNAFCEACARELADYPLKESLFRAPDPASVEDGNPAMVAASEFGQLPENQKDILKTLWEHRKISPSEKSWSFRPGPANPNLAEFETATAGLLPTGWVGVAPQTGTVRLTDKGAAFCQAYAAEIDAYLLKRQSFVPGGKN